MEYITGRFYAITQRSGEVVIDRLRRVDKDGCATDLIFDFLEEYLDKDWDLVRLGLSGIDAWTGAKVREATKEEINTLISDCIRYHEKKVLELMALKDSEAIKP